MSSLRRSSHCSCHRSSTNPTRLDDPRRGDVDEWGRSEHMRALARKVYDPLYRRWFRVEWEGLEKIPTDGGALLVANHAGAIPSDAPAIMHGIETELDRPVYGLADHFFKGVPVVGTLWAAQRRRRRAPRQRVPPAARAAAARPRVPRGQQGHRRRPTSERYRLRRFGRGGFVEIAMRAGVPDRADRRRRRRGVDADPVQGRRRWPRPSASPTSPSPPTCWPSARSARSRTSRPSSSSGCSIRCGSTCEPDQPRYSRSRIMDESEAIRQRIQEALYEMLRSGDRSGSADGATSPHHRSRHVLGRPGGPGPRSARRRRGDHRARRARAAGRAGAHRVRAQRRELLDPRPASCRPPASTRSCTRSSSSTRRRWRRKHMHEINVIGTMNLFAAASSSGQHGARRGGEVVDADLRQSAAGPVLVPRGEPTHVDTDDTESSRACSRSRATSATSPRTTRTCA